MEPALFTIISGGQSGVDRAALDVAIAHGIPYVGWCPQGGWAEDYPDPPGLLAAYPGLRQTPQRDPGQRSEWNVRDADALLVLTDTAGLSASKGTGFAVGCAERLGKPCLVISLDAADREPQVSQWIGSLGRPLALCIGGPRESEAPGIAAKATAFLHALFAT